VGYTFLKSAKYLMSSSEMLTSNEYALRLLLINISGDDIKFFAGLRQALTKEFQLTSSAYFTQRGFDESYVINLSLLFKELQHG